MNPTLRPARALPMAVCLALVAALALVTTGPAGARPAPARQHATTLAQPVVGSCHDYSRKQLRRTSDRSAAVPCTGPHTAQTVSVVTVKRSVAASRVFARYGPRCYRALSGTLGASRTEVVSTAYGLAFFRPTKKQQKQGARWLRCDAVLSGGSRLEQLPTPLVSRPISDSVARCAVGKNQVTTVCSRKHTFRATGTVTRKGAYPSLSRFAQISAAKCPAKVMSPKSFVLYFPDREQWQGGVRAMACLSKTSR